MPAFVIRAKLIDEDELAGAPAGFKRAKARWREFPEKQYTLQISMDDCTGCQLCVETCPAKDKSQIGRKAINMKPRLDMPAELGAHWDYFLTLPTSRVTAAQHPRLHQGQGRAAQGAALRVFERVRRCGETPYLKILSQLFGDRALIGNATGCSSIYGGNLPTTPYTVDADGRGPAWNNSLFEDTAEFGMGMRLAVERQNAYAKEIITAMREELGGELVDGLLNADQTTEDGIEQQRKRVAQLKDKIKNRRDPRSLDLQRIADQLVRKSVWIVGGDGWAYDIGYGGLDHVLASGRNVNVLVLDTEVYSNTGGQSSKSTPIGAVAKFASAESAPPRRTSESWP